MLFEIFRFQDRDKDFLITKYCAQANQRFNESFVGRKTSHKMLKICAKR